MLQKTKAPSGERSTRNPGPLRVGVVVDADDETLEGFSKTLALDYVQLHGSETTERVKEIKALLGIGVIKVIKVREKEDVEEAKAFRDLADLILFDTKPERGDALPGGTGRRFPWHFLKSFQSQRPCLLAGGLNPGNAEIALLLSEANGLDVSSGVEEEEGIKSHRLVTDFLAAVKENR